MTGEARRYKVLIDSSRFDGRPRNGQVTHFEDERGRMVRGVVLGAKISTRYKGQWVVELEVRGGGA